MKKRSQSEPVCPDPLNRSLNYADIVESLSPVSVGFPGFRAGLVWPGKIARLCALILVLVNQPVHGTTLYWDGTGTIWGDVKSWSAVDDASIPDPIAAPGANDIAMFAGNSALIAQLVNLNGDQSILGLATNASNMFVTTIRSDGPNRVLSLGSGGIDHTGGGLAIGAAISFQQVTVSLQGTQTWNSSSAGAEAAPIVVFNGVSIGKGGDQVLTLTGINNGARINGLVSDGAGVLGIAKTGTGVWTLAGANAYTGATVISGGSLRIGNSLALGSIAAGTSVESNAALQLEGSVIVSGETLSLAGNGAGANTGALRSLGGFNVWDGNIHILPSATTRVASDIGTLSITGDIILSSTPSDQLVLQGSGDGMISGSISGPSNLTKGALGAGTWSVFGENSYTGRTVITNGTLIVRSINRVSGGMVSSNLGAPTTGTNGTIDLGGGTTTAVLRYEGAGETTDRVINLAGTAGGGTIDQSGHNLLEFTSAVTAGPGAKTLTLQGSYLGNGKISGPIGNEVSVTKSGSNTWTLTGANTYTGSTNINAGTLIADLSLNTGGVLPSTTAITLGGGTLNILGAGSAVSVQPVTSLSATGGSSRIAVNPRGGAGTTMTIASPNVTTVSGSRVLFDYTQGTTSGAVIGNNVIEWNANLTNGLIGLGYVVTDNGGIGFATVSAGKVVRLIPTLSLPQAGAIGTENYLLSTDAPPSTPGSLNLAQTANQAINTLTVDTAATSGTMTLGNTILSAQALLVNGSTTRTFTIAGSAPGGLQALAAGGNLVLEQNAGTLAISAPILDNAGSGLINNGKGTTVLNGANTYAGVTILNDGLTRFAGSMGSGAILINNNARAQVSVSTGLNSANDITFGPGSTGRFQLFSSDATIGSLNTDAVVGTPIVEVLTSLPRTLTISPRSNSNFAGQFGGPSFLSLILAPSDPAAVFTLSGSAAYNAKNEGTTTVLGPGIVEFNKSWTDAVTGNLTIANGGRLRFLQSNQIADNATVTISGLGSSFNGTGAGEVPYALNEKFKNLTMTGGAFTTGAGAIGLNISGTTNITGGADETVVVASGGSQMVTKSLSLTNMPATAGGDIFTPNSFTIYGNSTTAPSRLSVGSGGLLLNGSAINLRGGGFAARGSRLVLDGDVMTTGTAPSAINLDMAGGTFNIVSVELSGSAGSVERIFNVGGMGADLSISAPLVNGAATTASITKTGPGTLTLSGYNTYNGPTHVKAGALIVSGQALDSAAIIGDAASPMTRATLMGDDRSQSFTALEEISAITAGAVIAPGLNAASTGILKAGWFSLTNSARLSIEIGGVSPGGNDHNGYDRISSRSPASVSGGVLDLLDISQADLPSDALLFIVVNHWESLPNSLFSTVTLDGAPILDLNNIVIGHQQFALVNNANYDGLTGPYGGASTGGNDIALIAVPELNTLLILLAAAPALGLRRPRMTLQRRIVKQHFAMEL